MTETKEIHCESCHRNVIVNKSWQYKTCPVCLKNKREKRSEKKKLKKRLMDKAVEVYTKGKNWWDFLKEIPLFKPRKMPWHLKNFGNYKQKHPDATWQEYIAELTEFRRQNRKVKLPSSIEHKREDKADLDKKRIMHEIFHDFEDRSNAVDLWHGDKSHSETIRKHHEDANKLEELLKEKKHARKTDKYDYEADLEEIIEKHSKKEEND